MWGEMVSRAGAGPTPCPVGELTPPLLSEKFDALCSDAFAARARELAGQMGAEDGVGGGLDHFVRWLPRDNLLCDVKLLLPTPELALASWELRGDGLKVCSEVMAMRRQRIARLGWCARVCSSDANQKVTRHKLKCGARLEHSAASRREPAPRTSSSSPLLSDTGALA